MPRSPGSFSNKYAACWMTCRRSPRLLDRGVINGDRGRMAPVFTVAGSSVEGLFSTRKIYSPSRPMAKGDRLQFCKLDGVRAMIASLFRILRPPEYVFLSATGHGHPVQNSGAQHQSRLPSRAVRAHRDVPDTHQPGGFEAVNRFRDLPLPLAKVTTFHDRIEKRSLEHCPRDVLIQYHSQYGSRFVQRVKQRTRCDRPTSGMNPECRVRQFQADLRNPSGSSPAHVSTSGMPRPRISRATHIPKSPAVCWCSEAGAPTASP